MQNSNVISGLKIGSKKPEILLRHTGLQILVEKRKNVRFEGPIRHQWRSDAGAHIFHQISVIRRRVIQAVDAHIIRVAGRRPACFRHHDVDVAVPDPFHRRVNRVHLRGKHVRVVQPRRAVQKAAVRPEQGVVGGLVGEAEIRVGADHERRVRLPVELQNRGEYDPVVDSPEPTRTRRVGDGEYPEGMRRWDLNLSGEARRLQGGVDGLHRREEVRDEVAVAGGDDLVADGDAADSGGGVEGEDVGGEPCMGAGGFGDCQNGVVGDGDGEGDGGVGEGSDNVGVGVENLDFIDGGFVLDECGDLPRRREVVRHRAVVDADGMRRRGWVAL